MSGLVLCKNLLLRDNVSGNTFRILYLPDAATGQGYWIQTDGKSNIPKPFSIEDVSRCIYTGGYSPVIDSTRIGMPDDRGLSKASIAIRDRSYRLIKDIVNNEPAVYDRMERGKLLHEVESKTGVKASNLYDYLGAWWRNGMTANALLPSFGNCGRGREIGFVPKTKLGRRKKETLQGKHNGKILTQHDFDIFQKVMDEMYQTEKKLSLTYVYKYMLAHYYTRPRFEGDTDPDPLPPEEKPSYMQLYYWAKKNQDIVETARKRDGHKFELKDRGTPGKAETTVKGPGMCFQVDATIGDFYLVRESDRRQIIGRPVVFFMRDAKTKIIAGMHITLENTSWNEALMTLKNCVEDKVEYCKRFGVHITPEQWPCHHLPVAITADNGEFGDTGVEDVIARLGIVIDNTPPYRGDLKALIENFFNKTHMMLKPIVPGYVDKDADQRGSIDRRKEACIDLKTFTRITIQAVVFFNNHWYDENYGRTPEMIANGVRPIPVELWNYGMQYQTGVLKKVSVDEIYKVLLPHKTATVTASGILYNELYYTCEKAEREDWYAKARISGRWSIPCNVDTSNVEHIYLIDDNGDVVKCDLMRKNKAFSGYSQDELDHMHGMIEAEKADYTQTLERATTKLILEIEKEVGRCEAEKADAAKAGGAGSMSKSNVREQRKAEKDELSGKTAALKEQGETCATNGHCSAREPRRTAEDGGNDLIDEVLKSKGLM